MIQGALFHVFRNTPFGRDTFLSSVYFSKQTKTPICVYIPKHTQFLMYFKRRAVTVDLDREFLHDPQTARAHAEQIINKYRVNADFIIPNDFTALELPDIPVDFNYMCCPRSISDLSTKIGFGYIGPKVRQIVQYSSFPVMIPTPVFKKWRSIVVFFGGSANSIRALKVAKNLQKRTGQKLIVFTMSERKPQNHFIDILSQNNMLESVENPDVQWIFNKKQSLRKSLYKVPSEALVVIGAYGHGVIKEVLFGSVMETVQSVLPNNMLIIGPDN